MTVRRPERLAYSVLTIAGLLAAIIGVGLVWLPAAFVLGGVAFAGLGLIGLGMRNR